MIMLTSLTEDSYDSAPNDVRWIEPAPDRGEPANLLAPTGWRFPVTQAPPARRPSRSRSAKNRLPSGDNTDISAVTRPRQPLHKTAGNTPAEVPERTLSHRPQPAYSPRRATIEACTASVVLVYPQSRSLEPLHHPL